MFQWSKELRVKVNVVKYFPGREKYGEMAKLEAVK